MNELERIFQELRESYPDSIEIGELAFKTNLTEKQISAFVRQLSNVKRVERGKGVCFVLKIEGHNRVSQNGLMLP